MALGWQCEWAYAGLLQEEAPLTDFYDIHELKRCELLTEVLRRFSQADVETLGELALTEDRTPEQIWGDLQSEEYRTVLNTRPRHARLLAPTWLQGRQ